MTVPTARALPDADVDACAALLAKGSKSFNAAGRLLPSRLRPDVVVLYAFCRIADDLVDEAVVPAQGVRAVRAMLDRVYAGQPADGPFGAVERAFTRLVQRHALPRALPEALIEGFVWDAEGRRYETMSDTLDYAARVAAVVGVMMTVLMGVRDAATLARACDLGLAMQLTNIARDVGEDARMGRVYLPEAWLAAEGLSSAALLRAPQHGAPLGRVVTRLLDHAEELYTRSERGIPGLPADCRTAIWAARLIYADIGRVIRRAGANSVDRRASTSKWRKLYLLWRARRAARRSASDEPGQTLAPAPQSAFLLVGL